MCSYPYIAFPTYLGVPIPKLMLPKLLISLWNIKSY